MVIDAGKDDMMARFLGGRFGKYMPHLDFHAAIITHCDEDHYGGFRDLVGTAGFKHLYHNGLMETASSYDGPNDSSVVRKKAVRLGMKRGKHYRDFPEDDADFRSAFSDPKPRGDFAEFAEDFLQDPRWGPASFLGRANPREGGAQAFLPGFGPTDGRDYQIELLGPLYEHDAQGRKLLPVYGDHGVTKNGNSILMRLEYGRFSVFFGGDLNAPAEQHILASYAGRDAFPKISRRGDFQTKEALEIELDALSQATRSALSSTVMKACHHGSADVTDAFVRAVNPAAYVISSGETGGYVHPRPDLLGRLGKLSHGEAPVILSTELQRGSRSDDDFEDADALRKALRGMTTADLAGEALPDSVETLVARLARSNVQVYGAIYLKTDGERMVTAFKKENNSPKDRWFHFEYKLTDEGVEPVASSGGH